MRLGKHSVITGRSIFSVLITLLLLAALRQPIAIPRRPMRIALAMGVAYAVMLYGYLGAMNYLPVSLVILIYFIHPVLVGLIVMYLGQERLTIISVGALRRMGLAPARYRHRGRDRGDLCYGDASLAQLNIRSWR